jgi:hypothetical protein
MKRFVCTFIFLVAATALVFPQSLEAQSAEIEKALMAAPAQARQGAGVISWNDDYTWETLKEGSNPMVCYDRSGQLDNHQPLSYQIATNRPQTFQDLDY